MPFIGEITLEYCDIETPGVSREDVIAAARLTPRDVRDWFLTLRRGDDQNEEYMDATMEEEASFSVRCREDGQSSRTVGAVGEDLLEALVLSFYDHDRAWKTLCAWEEIAPQRGFSVKGLFR